MLGVPLLAAGRVIGVLHVGTLQARRFTTEEAELLELAADRVAFATQARLLEIERAAARLLERSLLPPSLPACPGLEFAVRYVSAEGRGVGGDWYDLFRLPSDDLWVVTGDVAGHGLRAAVVMGRLRSTLRAYALQVDSPDGSPPATDRKLQHFEIGEMATVLCATSSPPFDEFRICSAGHPPPILQRPGDPARPLNILPDPPLGTPTRDATVLRGGAVPARRAAPVLHRRPHRAPRGTPRLRAGAAVRRHSGRWGPQHRLSPGDAAPGGQHGARATTSRWWPFAGWPRRTEGGSRSQPGRGAKTKTLVGRQT